MLDAGGAQPWAVAYSGGADSTALLWAAQRLWPGQVQAFHIHHGLQAVADDFAHHVVQTCAALGVPLRLVRVQAGHAPGQSPEDAARQARYAELARLAQAHQVDWVLLGQHAQDQVETVLLALTRGAGVPGLAGMPEAMERHGVRFGRPLLHTDGRVLRAELAAQGVAHVQDPSNQDERYTRNRIRARLVPGLLEAFPASLDTFGRSARALAQAQRVLAEVAEQDLQAVGQPPAIAAVRRLGRDRQANLLRHWLRQGWGVAPSEAQLLELLDQLAACATRGHRIQLKVADGRVQRQGAVLVFARDL
nr:tRNA lysidine(34) synthetase TilS [Macromonas nakdongensis]